MLTIMVALGETDCETIRDGALAQPVNAISSLVFSLVGLGLLLWANSAQAWERRFRSVVGVLFVLTGIGSFLYHGPQTAGSLFAHDVTFLAVLAVVAGTHIALALRWSEPASWLATGTLIALYVIILIVWPTATNILAASAVVLVVAGDIPLHRVGGLDGRWYGAALVLMALAVVFFGLSRSGGPICSPDSLLQGHGMWHVLGACALGAYVVGTAPTRARMETH